MLGFRGRAEGGRAYKGQVAEDHSMLYSLMAARRKDDGQPLSDLHICAQAFTFVLAGQHYSHQFAFCYKNKKALLCQQVLKEAIRSSGLLSSLQGLSESNMHSPVLTV